MMQIQVTTDNHIHGGERLIADISEGLQGALKRYDHQITRVEVHLADVNGPKGADNDKRCLIEARLAGHQPIVASHQAATVDESVEGASDKLFRAIETTLGRLHDAKGHKTSAGGDQVI
ncbi:HPF/RaiA family ribosome-associated protein [Paludisphaera mucosa]|uniref:HPF/RaiA family ribosome-associated protein n=1 Tax=Paludisphaera mucosa TaxID=3030827 RepID=A0ABT6F9C8_9BACT|nr:HPF/RaiA family ribosome-associated protein [Paludisphaera mucosa]MDG3004176.1 HPF/RaiA family ribosome-associated protein [Paludisphaera mucosa]